MRAVAHRLYPQHGRSGKIDVKQLIEQLDDSALMAAADAYFSGLDVDSEQCHKPFSNVADAIHITRNVSLLLQAADVFRGADVLDFGCATGWLSMAMANLGCNVVGVDVAPSALRLAESLLQERGLRAGGSLRYQVYDGRKLPLDDCSMDRVVCFDAFHHVKDQDATLGELARVLRPGGIIAMLEPGPFHSQTAQSQAEMAQYKVIENDIVMSAIAAAALRNGLDEPQLLVQLQQPQVVTFQQYQQWLDAEEFPSGDGRRLLTRLHHQLANTQCFFLRKSGAPLGADSRRAEALAAKLQVVSTQVVQGKPNTIELHFRIQNTGEATWVCKPGAVGQVNLGCQLLREDNSVELLDFKRFPIAPAPVLPGQVLELTIQLPLRPECAYSYRLDLVAENIAWFSQVGRCKPVHLRHDGTVISNGRSI